jgi:cell wall-associated NlpC family hydrolase
MADAPTKVDIAAADGDRIVTQAATWQMTPYAPDTDADKYKGPGAEKGVEADCSGSVWKIYGNVGYRYDYRQSSAFDDYARLPHSPFRELDDKEARQAGDVVLYRHHMSIYAGDDLVWSAHKTGFGFAKFSVSYFGPPLGFYRYQIYAPGM